MTSGRRPIRLGVVGCGAVFERYYAPALQRVGSYSIVALCDTSQERLARFRSALPDTQFFTSVTKMLDQTTPAAVFIATPPQTHHAIAMEALGRGCHLLMEKPMTVLTEHAEEICELAERQGLVVWVGYNRRFRQDYAALRARLQSVAAERIQGVHFMLTADLGQWPGQASRARDRAQGGRVVDETAPHQLDVVPWLFGAPIAELRVVVVENAAAGMGELLRYELRLGNGVVATCVASYGAYREFFDVQVDDRVWRLHPAGLLDVRASVAAALVPWLRLQAQADWAMRGLLRRPSRTQDSFERQFEAFAKAVIGDGAPAGGATAQDGLAAVRAVEACYESLAADGKWVAVRAAGTTA